MATRVYKAVHDKTGIELIGTASELAERLGVATSAVYKTAIEGKKVSGHWEIKKTDEAVERRTEYKMTADFCERWDAVTKPFRELSARRAGGADA